ncbi:MAG: hypothetical protein AAB937_01470 [Patescibacteria group bacterium]
MSQAKELTWKVHGGHYRILSADLDSIMKSREGLPHIWHGVAADGSSGIFATTKIISDHDKKVSYTSHRVMD